MGRKFRYSIEDKIYAVNAYRSGSKSIQEICEDIGMHYCKGGGSCIRQWAKKYSEFGESILYDKPHNKSYSAELKVQAVESYLNGEGSIDVVCIRHEITSNAILRRWIKKYNAIRELKDYNPKREVYMAEARRKTSIEERKKIVEYCITHNRDYKGTASLFDVSYNQVYSWVKKYDANGEDGLLDKRGHHITDDEVDELEHLRRENLRLKRKLQESEMAVELLKKVKEFEGM